MSDQDFFFDEEENETTKKPEKKAAAGRPAQRTAAPAAKPQVFQQSVSTTVAALVAVIALLFGVIIGFLIPKGAATPTTTGTGAVAPQLTPEQLQSGQLPPGHPDISGMTGGQTMTTGTPTTGAAESTGSGN
ncbi:MAG: hypothetical protein N3B11_03735 [Coriobacteriia bacterium]|nr:hypothetical protein [Coriobacteriia bacterium]